MLWKHHSIHINLTNLQSKFFKSIGDKYSNKQLHSRANIGKITTPL